MAKSKGLDIVKRHCARLKSWSTATQSVLWYVCHQRSHVLCHMDRDYGLRLSRVRNNATVVRQYCDNAIVPRPRLLPGAVSVAEAAGDVCW
jgi:hypothetical protein